MKSLTKFAVLGFLLLFAGWCFAQSASKAQTTPPKTSLREPAKPEEEDAVPPVEPNAIFPAVVARVNGSPILGRDLEVLVRRELAPIGNPEWKNLREDYRSELILAGLDTLIRTKLLYQKALASGIKATSTEVQAELQKISKSFNSDAEMNTALANQMTDRASLEKNLYQSLAVSKYLDENVNKKITVAPEEIAKYYTGHLERFQHPDVVKTSHILIKAGETEEQRALAKKRAEALLDRARKGEDFAKLAKEYSTDGSASAGGDVGFNAKADLDPEYGKAAFSLPVGGVKLIESEYGYHIIKVTGKKKEGLYTLEDMKDQLTQFLKNQKIQEELTKLVDQLRDLAKVEILIPAGQPGRAVTDTGEEVILNTDEIKTNDTEFNKEAVDLYHQAFYNSANTWRVNKWLGILTEQNPNDVWITQEIIVETRPDFIIETGTLCGGSAALWSTILEQVNPEGRVITIDILDQAQQARKLPIVQKHVDFLHGSSTATDIVDDVKNRVKGKKALVILDSDHSKQHVLNELAAYAPLVTVGSYLIVQDTNVNGHPVDKTFGPGPMEAVTEFLAANSNFVPDRGRERLMFTMNPSGYLKRIR